MKRFDYVVTPAERLLGVPFPPAIAPRLYAPLTALGAALVLVAGAGAIEEARLHAADRDVAEARLRLAGANTTVARVQIISADVVRLRALAALGNALPSDAWLTAVHVERRTLGLEGRATGIATVAAAMAALTRLPAYEGARLLNVRDDPARTGVTYAIALESSR